MQKLWAKLALIAAVAVAIFMTGAVVAPPEAGAHCGEHAGSCGGYWESTGGYCDGLDWHDTGNWIEYSCSGTCYNNNTAGCCESPSACANAACKPGGCSWEQGTYTNCWNGQTGDWNTGVRTECMQNFGECGGGCMSNEDCPNSAWCSDYECHC